ncbi:MAG: F0F1 ATP synthase subunit A [Fimbriimonas sp.]
MGDLQTLFPNLLAQLPEERKDVGTAVQASAPPAQAEAGHHGPSFWGLIAYIVLVLAAIFLLIGKAKKGWNGRVFQGFWANCSEQLYLFIRNMCVGTIGSHGAKYIPMMTTFWLVIFWSNFCSLFMPSAPTADLSFNLGLAFIAIGYVQWEGIKANGLFGHLSHFAGPKLGGVLTLISVMIFGIELISELMKNVSLSLRLYGNIHGGHQAVEAMNALGEGFYVPIGAFLLPIKLLTCVVQAMIFTLLTCVYLSLVTHHDDEHHDEAHPEEPHVMVGA